MIWAMIILTEGDWYVSYDKTLFGRENGRYKKEQSEPLMNSMFALFFKDVDICLSFIIPVRFIVVELNYGDTDHFLHSQNHSRIDVQLTAQFSANFK